MTDLQIVVQQDIEKANEYREINDVEMIDGKISADFCIGESGDMCSCGNYVSYEKIFDTWADFTAYAESFFALQN